MAYVQDSSLLHTYATPQSLKYYDDKNWAWVLTHWHVKISAYPKSGERINIYTWPVRYKGYFGERGFEVQSSGGDSLLVANSNWILLERDTLSPIRANNEIISQYGEMYPFLLERDFAMPIYDGMELIGSHEYTVSRRDIDTNSHVNNVKYIEWIYDYLPGDLYSDFYATDLKVAYKKETLLGDKVKINLYRKGLDPEIFTTIEKDDQLATEIYIRFSRFD